MFSTPSELFANRWQQEGGCVRVVKETLGAEFGPWRDEATLGRVGVAHVGVVRVYMPGIVSVELDGDGYSQFVLAEYIRPEFLSLQDVFDIASYHALEGLRGKRSTGTLADAAELCRYEFNGVQCFVGALIPDQGIREILDGAYNEPEVIQALRDAGVPSTPGMQTLLGALQNIHDSIGVRLTAGRRRHVWRRSLRRLASRLNLTCQDRLWLLDPQERKEYESAANETNQ